MVVVMQFIGVEYIPANDNVQLSTTPPTRTEWWRVLLEINRDV